MKYTIEKHQHYAILTLNEERLTSLKTPEFKSELVLLHNNGMKNLILCLDDVQHIDSSGLSALLMGNRLCQSSGGILVVCNITPVVQKMINIAHLGDVLQVLPTQAEAVEAVNMHVLEQDLLGEENNASDGDQDSRDAENRLEEEDPGSSL